LTSDLNPGHPKCSFCFRINHPEY